MKLLLILVVVLIGMVGLEANDENSYQIHKQAAISSFAGTPWSAERQIKLAEKASAIQPQLVESSEKLTFPISEDTLKKLYSEAQKSTIPLFAYSSMIDKKAGAVKAISPEAAKTQTFAVAFGIQRTFNREMPSETVAGGWGPLKRPNDLAILNIFEKKDAVLNGVLFELPLSDLLILTKREVGYDLIPVLVMKWEDAIDSQKEPELLLAYTFKAPDFTGEGTRYTNDKSNPVPGYFDTLQKGLDKVGADFKAMWWDTTFLADKKTPVSELPYNNVDMNAADRE